jgi:hypothetical protein
MAGFEKWSEALAEAVAEGAGWIAIRLIDIRETRTLLEAATRESGAAPWPCFVFSRMDHA